MSTTQESTGVGEIASASTVELSDPAISCGSDAVVGIVGGKAAGLARLVAEGFRVPQGFVITTAAHTQFLEDAGLTTSVGPWLEALDWSDASAVQAATEKLRADIAAAAIPADLADEITSSYRALGDDPLVAVRSSGVAEDLIDASFAGLHDTFLAVRGEEDLLDAVRRSWASMWTARATAYRHDGTVDQVTLRLAVVVQSLVDAEAAGVMFTVNTMTGRTDEITIEANWGLGESVVSGSVTPDHYIVAADDGRIKKTVVGSKEHKIICDESGSGTKKVDNAVDRRGSQVLTTEQLQAIARLGVAVSDSREGLPQDLEWALAPDGEVYLLQARPVTGLDLTWDEAVDAWHETPEEDDALWTHSFADNFWSGVATPLHYSIRAQGLDRAYRHWARIHGRPDLAERWWFKSHRATVYFNASADREWQKMLWPAGLRDLTNLPPAWHDELNREETSLTQIATVWIRNQLLDPQHNILNSIQASLDFIDANWDTAGGLDDAERRAVSDADLIAECERGVEISWETWIHEWNSFFWYATGAFVLLGKMLTEWYGDASGFQALISGLPDTAMSREQRALRRLAERIESTPELAKTFAENEGAAFFAALEDSDVGRAFLDEYAVFIREHGHGGHQDRDIFYPRRADDPALDYNSFQLLMGPDVRDLDTTEANNVAKRDALTKEIADSLSTQPFGLFKAEAFKVTVDWIYRLLKYRDDQRPFLDIFAYRKKRDFAELGRRLQERGVLDRADDFYFLSREELYRIFDTGKATALDRAKIAGRRTVFDRRMKGEEPTPPYLQHGIPADLDAAPAATSDSDDAGTPGSDERIHQGVGASPGTTVATARVAFTLDELPRVQPGEVLIVPATDPGWTAVFSRVSGIVFEYGGILSHAACLSREYGLPAIQLTGATMIIPDGATIEMNGATGKIRLPDSMSQADA